MKKFVDVCTNCHHHQKEHKLGDDSCNLCKCKRFEWTLIGDDEVEEFKKTYDKFKKL